MKNVYVIFGGSIGDGPYVVGVYAYKELAEQKLIEIFQKEREIYKTAWDATDSHNPFFKNDFEFYFDSRVNRGGSAHYIETHELLEQ